MNTRKSFDYFLTANPRLHCIACGCFEIDVPVDEVRVSVHATIHAD